MNFLEIPIKSVIAKDLLALARSTQTWEDYYNFKAIQAPYEILAQDPFLVSLFQRHPFVGGIVLLEPNVCYDWHIDTRRGVGVNMLLNPEIKSHCLFTNAEGVQFPFEELAYKPDTYYIFNTQNKHMVLNFDQPRYLFTIEFGADNTQLSFETLVQQIKNPAF